MCSGPWPLSLDATHWLVVGTPDNHGFVVPQLDAESGLGDQHGDGVADVLPTERGLLASDLDDAAVGGAALDLDRFRRPRNRPGARRPTGR